MMKLDGLDEALVGECQTWDGGSRVERLVYSGEAILDILMERDGMSEEDAWEWVDFNIEQAWVGLSTPIIVWEISWEDLDEQEPDDG
jgi:hypothetical protein